MQLLQQYYLNLQIEKHFRSLQLPQTDTKLERQALIRSLQSKGAFQAHEAPADVNAFPWPFGTLGYGCDPYYLTHGNIRFLYTYTDDTFERDKLYITMGILAVYRCDSEDPDALADEIIRIDTQLIPQWMESFDHLPEEELADLVVEAFSAQNHTVRNHPVVLDTYAALVYDTSVTQVRQAISRERNLFTDEHAFHLTNEEYTEFHSFMSHPPRLRKSDYHPYALTFTGLFLLSTRINTPLAIRTNIGVIRTVSKEVPFTDLLQQIASSTPTNATEETNSQNLKQ